MARTSRFRLIHDVIHREIKYFVEFSQITALVDANSDVEGYYVNEDFHKSHNSVNGKCGKSIEMHVGWSLNLFK